MRIELIGGPGDGAVFEVDPRTTIFLYIHQATKEHVYEKIHERIVEQLPSGAIQVRYKTQWVHSSRCAACQKR